MGVAARLSTPRTMQPAKRGQAAGAASSTARRSRCTALGGAIAGPFTRASEIAATSRAMPRTDIASPRFGVTPRSSTASSRPRYSRRGGRAERPQAARGSRRKPRPARAPSRTRACRATRRRGSSPRGSRRRRGAWRRPRASALFKPARALGAPQTICSGSPLPFVTRQTRSLSACGCGSQLRISATTTPVNGGAASAMPSSSNPAMVRREPSSGAGQGACDPVPQPGVRDLHAQSVRNCLRNRRSFSKNSRRSLTP